VRRDSGQPRHGGKGTHQPLGRFIAEELEYQVQAPVDEAQAFKTIALRTCPMLILHLERSRAISSSKIPATKARCSDVSLLYMSVSLMAHC
jgi:hypothetical protein